MDLKIDLNKPFKNVKGIVIKNRETEESEPADMLLSHLLGNCLASQKSSTKSRKFLGWADKLYDTGVIEIDNSDYDTIWNVLESESSGMNAMMCGRIQNEMSNQKDDQKKNV